MAVIMVVNDDSPASIDDIVNPADGEMEAFLLLAGWEQAEIPYRTWWCKGHLAYPLRTAYWVARSRLSSGGDHEP